MQEVLSEKVCSACCYDVDGKSECQTPSLFPLKYKLLTFGNMLIILHSVALIWKYVDNNEQIGGKKIGCFDL